MHEPEPDTTTVPTDELAAEYDAAWSAGLPAPGPLWTARPWVAPVVRAEQGKAARARVPRSSHAAFAVAPGRDPIEILDASTGAPGAGCRAMDVTLVERELAALWRKEASTDEAVIRASTSSGMTLALAPPVKRVTEITSGSSAGNRRTGIS